MYGQPGEFRYKSGKDSEVTKAFCPNCGSPVFGRNTRMPGHVTIPLGSIDDARDLCVQVIIFARERKHWDEHGRGVTSFETQPDWIPDAI